jgi:hypothetical protein
MEPIRLSTEGWTSDKEHNFVQQLGGSRIKADRISGENAVEVHYTNAGQLDKAKEIHAFYCL